MHLQQPQGQRCDQQHFESPGLDERHALAKTVSGGKAILMALVGRPSVSQLISYRNVSRLRRVPKIAQTITGPYPLQTSTARR